MKKQIAKLSKAIDLITERIDGQMSEEKELTKANELLCQILTTLKNENK